MAPFWDSTAFAFESFFYVCVWLHHLSELLGVDSDHVFLDPQHITPHREEPLSFVH